MVDALINLLILALVAKIAYDEGHFQGRRMVREEWIRSLKWEAAMACSKDQYHLTLQENLRRMNTSRDEAVRMTNEHHGYGSSTALQHDVPDTIVDAPMQQPRGGDAA